jgi:uncharacterized Ntn-hydrolase superfamily protein
MKATVLAMRALSSANVVFGVVVLRHLDPGETRRAALGHVGGDLHLAREREHVRRKTRIDQGSLDADRGLALLRFRERGGLVDHAVERTQETREVRQRGFVDMDGHAELL